MSIATLKIKEKVGAYSQVSRRGRATIDRVLSGKLSNQESERPQSQNSNGNNRQPMNMHSPYSFGQPAKATQDHFPMPDKRTVKNMMLGLRTKTADHKTRAVVAS